MKKLSAFFILLFASGIYASDGDRKTAIAAQTDKAPPTKTIAQQKHTLWLEDHPERCAWIAKGFSAKAGIDATHVQKKMPVALAKHIEEFALGTKQKTLFISTHAKELAPAVWSTSSKSYADSIFFYLERLRTSDSKPESLRSDYLPDRESHQIETLNMYYVEGSPDIRVTLTEQQYDKLEHCTFAQLRYLVHLWDTRKENKKRKRTLPDQKLNAADEDWAMRFQNAAHIALPPQQSAEHRSFQKAAKTNPVLQTMLAHLNRNYTITLTDDTSSPALKSDNVNN